jgi:hypothetical protein
VKSEVKGTGTFSASKYGEISVKIMKKGLKIDKKGVI